MRILIFSTSVFFFIQFSNAQSFDQSGIKIINLKKAFELQQDISLSKFISEIDLVPLETNPQALIGGLVYYEITNEYIIVRQIRMDGTNQILMFDKITGQFIREIGKQGKGPNEYSSFSMIPFNDIKKELYAQSRYRELLAFNLSGKLVGKINTKAQLNINNQKETIDLSADYIYFTNRLDNGIFAGYVVNSSGSQDKKIVLLNKNGVINIFPNHLTWKKPGYNMRIGPSGTSVFFRYNNKLNFFENFCDTLYQVTKETLIPRYYFDWGENRIPYQRQGEITMSKPLFYSSFFIVDMYESEKYIFIHVTHDGKSFIGFLNKKDNSVEFCKSGSSTTATFTDDIYSLIDALPKCITSNNELAFELEPTKLLKWFAKNPEMELQFRKKQPLLKDMNELSNPVIAIAKCKK